MRRLGTDGWAGLAMLVVSVAVAGPVLIGVAEPTIPRGWWIALFVVFLASLLASTASGSSLIRYGGFVGATTTAWATVLTAPGMGLLLILLVVVAAVSVYVAPLGVGFVVVALNTGVVAAVTVPGEPDVSESGMLIGFYLLIQLATLLSSATLIREQRIRRELTEAHVELQAASILLSESARTAERLRISRELHDTIGHELTVLTLELETSRHLDGAAAGEHLERADRVARGLLREVRATVGALRTEGPDLERALRAMTADLPGLDVSVDVTLPVRIGEDESAALVRAAQEIVTNTIRHAEARTLGIEITGDDNGIVLCAHDDGRGAQDILLGHGLVGLRERFAALGGDVDVDGRHGFRVTARMPAP